MFTKQSNGSRVKAQAVTCAKLTAALIGIEAPVNLLIHHRHELTPKKRRQHLRELTEAEQRFKAILPDAAGCFAPLESVTPRQWAYQLVCNVNDLVTAARCFADPDFDEFDLTQEADRCKELLRWIAEKSNRAYAGGEVAALPNVQRADESRQLPRLHDGQRKALSELKRAVSSIGYVKLANIAAVQHGTIRKWCMRNGPLWRYGVRNGGNKDGYYYDKSADQSVNETSKKNVP